MRDGVGILVLVIATQPALALGGIGVLGVLPAYAWARSRRIRARQG